MPTKGEATDDSGSSPKTRAPEQHEETRHAMPPLLPASNGAIAAAGMKLTKLAEYFGPSLGHIFLIPHPWIGVLLWAALAWNPRHAGFALLGLVVALVYERGLHIPEDSQVGGGLKANALLASVAAGWMTAPTAYPLVIQIGIAIAAASCAFAVTAAILRVLKGGTIPSLLWGFSFVAAAMFAIFPLATRMAAQGLTWWREPLTGPASWTIAFLRSIGSLVFTPSIETGVIVVAAVLIWSRTALAAGVVAWVAGALVATQLTRLGVAYNWLPSSYTYFVSGMAIGAFLILPAYSSMFLAAMAGVGASLFEVSLQNLAPGFAYLPIAANLTIWCGLGTLSFAKDRPELWRNRWPRVPPEVAWWRDASWSLRVGKREPLLTVPVEGPVSIAQGFDDRLSHTKEFRHALDFMRTSPQNSGIADGRAALAASLWNAAVTAPAAGVVDRVRDGVPDNPWGLGNFAEPWGNYVAIHLDQGDWALLAHLRQGSIVVKPGARVEIGTYIGAVGNSGRSPVPHLHLQVQEGPEPGTSTRPFRLANYRSGTGLDDPLIEWNAAAVPPRGTQVMATRPNPEAYTLLASLAPGIAVWSVEQRGIVPRAFHERRTTFQVEHRIDARGRHHLMNWRGSLLLALAPDAWRVIEKRGRSPFLGVLAFGASVIPYAIEPGMTWTDLVPALPSDWVSLTAAPYQKQPFSYSRSICTSAPSAAAEHLVIESAVRPSRPQVPLRILCTFDRVRGPIAVEAKFEKGSLHYSLLSFTPGLPLFD